MTRRHASGARLLAAAFVLLLCAAGRARGLVFFVTNTNDGGPGSLRQAITDANGAAGGDSIAFQLPGPGPHTIAPTSALPVISEALDVDGASQAGFPGVRVEISGASAGPGVDGLVITGGSSTVRGLVINRFQPTFLGGGGNGIVLQGSGGNLLLDNRIGTNVAGTAVLGNGAAGVLISDSANNRIGASLAGEQHNLISGNGTGIRIIGFASMNNIVAGNFIGTDVSGALDRGNLGDGVAILAGTGNLLQSGSSPLVISGNDGNGVTIAGTSSATTVRSSRIGIDAAGLLARGNGSDGVEISGSPDNVIGGTDLAGRNIISGNVVNGVLLISGATNNRVEGNFIGTDLGGTTDQGNLANGVIASGANGNMIGGSAPGAGNLISGNGTNGVRLRSGASGNIVRGNRIGVDVSGILRLHNDIFGVEMLDGAVNNVIGGTAPEDRNQISGNGLSGVRFFDATTTGNVVIGNYIGTDPTGTFQVHNSGSGVTVEAAGNIVGGTAPGAGNLISGNNGNGVTLAVSGLVLEGNRIGTTADGLGPLGNLVYGVGVSSSNCRVGGLAPGAANTVAYNVLGGVGITGGSANSVHGNSIFGNVGLGIDLLGSPGVTPNDALDADSGPNGLQNFPVLTRAHGAGGLTNIEGTLHSRPFTTFTLHVYASPDCDESGYGEGRTFLGTLMVTTDELGNAPVAASFPVVTPLGHFVTATATDPAGSTSEFSACVGMAANFYTLTPCRVADTRGPDGPAIAANTSRQFPIAGRCAVPSTARAVALNLTVIDPTAQGHLAVVPPGGPFPVNSVLNYRAGQTRANNAILPLGPAGDAAIFAAQPSGTVHLAIDVTGYFE